MNTEFHLLALNVFVEMVGVGDVHREKTCAQIVVFAFITDRKWVPYYLTQLVISFVRILTIGYYLK